MSVQRKIVPFGMLLISCACCLADDDLITAPKDAPAYKLSNFRTEKDSFGNSLLAIDFRRTTKGSGAVFVKGKSARGRLSIGATVPTSTDSGTIRLKSFFPDRGQTQQDIELYLVQSHYVAEGTTLNMMVSNPVRLGNPGPATKPRQWTAEEKAAYEQYVRNKHDDSAHKPLKRYAVSANVPSDAEFVPNTAKLTRGTKLQACFQSKWYPITTLSENDDGSVNVRWDDWGADYDCSMLRSELIIDKSVLSSLGKHPAGRFPAVPAVAVANNMKRSVPTAKPRKNYPVTISVPGDSQFIPGDASLPTGTPLQACYAGKWNPITHLSHNADGTLTVRWDQYGPSFDCSMVRDQLIIKKDLLMQIQSDPSSVSFKDKVAKKQQKDYPVSIAVPSHSQLVPKDAKLKAGTRLEACWASKWNPITTLSENSDGTVNVRWDDFGPAYDCSMVRDQLIIRRSDLQALMGSSTTPEVRTWTDATGRFKVKARLSDRTKTHVTLLTETGKEVTLPLKKLSQADQDFLAGSTSKSDKPSE